MRWLDDDSNLDSLNHFKGLFDPPAIQLEMSTHGWEAATVSIKCQSRLSQTFVSVYPGYYFSQPLATLMSNRDQRHLLSQIRISIECGSSVSKSSAAYWFLSVAIWHPGSLSVHDIFFATSEMAVSFMIDPLARNMVVSL